MFSRRKIAPFTRGYWGDITETAALLKDAERVIVGVGSGLSAAGGLNYGSFALAQKWFPEYAAIGCKSIVEIQSLFGWQSRCELTSYWGYWARHIWHIRYEAEVTQPYLDLMELIKDKDYFICTTYCDGQIQKAGFPRERVCAGVSFLHRRVRTSNSVIHSVFESFCCPVFREGLTCKCRAISQQNRLSVAAAAS